jgi:hypothetical protein
MAIVWEHLSTVHGGMITDTYRARVPGGWLVQVQRSTGDNSASTGGLAFYPDPNHEWDGNSVQCQEHAHAA